MAEFPDFTPHYIESEDDIRARMDGNADADVDKIPLSYYQLTTEPPVKEFAIVWDILNDVIALSSYQFATGVYLDYKAGEAGLARKAAAKASGEVEFQGTGGTFIPAGTRVSTVSVSDEDQAYRFVTTESGTIDMIGLAVVIPVEAEEAGEAYNVSTGAIEIIEDNILGANTVFNYVSTTGGADIEDDEDLRSRISIALATPPGAGNAADYIRWALSRSGVGSVTVVPIWNGPGTVLVILLDTDNNPVSAGVMADVQEYLTGPPLLANPTTAPTAALNASAGNVTGTGITYKVTFVDQYGGETKPGTASSSPFSATAQRGALTAVPLGGTGVVKRNIYRADSTHGYKLIGTINDNVTTTFADNVTAGTTAIPQTNNTSNNEQGIAPIGALVTVSTPTLRPYAVVATVTHDAGYSLDGAGGTIATRSAIEGALSGYSASLGSGGDIVYKHVEAMFFTVPGVHDISGLTVDGGTSNVAIAATEIADLTMPVTLT